MARTLPEILRRFRPAVAPGPPAPAGVPVDRRAETEAELAVVFAALVSTTAAANDLREQARAEADRRRAQGTQDAQRLLSDARSRLTAVRADAATALLSSLDEERAELQHEAQAEATRLRQRADERLPEVVANVIGDVVRDVGDSRSSLEGDQAEEAVG